MLNGGTGFPNGELVYHLWWGSTGWWSRMLVQIPLLLLAAQHPEI